MTSIVENEDFWEKIKEEINDVPIYIQQSFQKEEIAQPVKLKNMFKDMSINEVINSLEITIRESSEGKATIFNVTLKKNLTIYQINLNSSLSDFTFSDQDMIVVQNIKTIIESKPIEFWIKHEPLEPAPKKQKYLNKQFQLLDMFSLSRYFFSYFTSIPLHEKPFQTINQ